MIVEDELLTYNDYIIIKLVTQLNEIREIARINLINTKEKSKEYYDRKTNPKNFKPRECVFTKRP